MAETPGDLHRLRADRALDRRLLWWAGMQWLVAFTIPGVVLAVRPGVSASRRFLALALALLVPFAGPVLAWIARGVRGGTIAPEPVAQRKPQRPTAADVNRLAERPAVLERLLSKDPGERLGALVHLASVGDDNAHDVLRWTIERGPTEVVLEAALTLEEIELRRTPRARAPQPPAIKPSPAHVAVPSKVAIAPALAALSPRAA